MEVIPLMQMMQIFCGTSLGILRMSLRLFTQRAARPYLEIIRILLLKFDTFDEDDVENKVLARANGLCSTLSTMLVDLLSPLCTVLVDPPSLSIEIHRKRGLICFTLYRFTPWLVMHYNCTTENDLLLPAQ